MNQKRIGIIISYTNLIIGMIVNIFLTPFLISKLGDVDYSVYKVMQSFAGPLSMFHLGISTITTRCIVRYQTVEGSSKQEKDNTLALSLIASVVMAAIVSIAAVVMCLFIPKIYGNTFSMDSITLAQKVFAIFVASSVFHMLTDAFSGCLIGHEKYAVSSAITLSKTIFKFVLIVTLLSLNCGVVTVVGVDLILSVAILSFSAWYTMLKLHEIPKYSYFDRKQLSEILVFGFAIFLQAFVNQVNNNADIMILGAYIEEKRIITMYSSALAIYSVYNSLISAITFTFLPKATRLVSKDATGEELTEFVIKPGRFQAIIGIACICGFALFGRNFISIWIGDTYKEAYWIILMLIIPVTIPLVENAAISILDATMKRLYRSTVLVIMATINIIVSIILIKPLGFWGAALGTVISLIIGHGVLMNIYYSKQYGMKIGYMFFSIFKGILPTGLLTTMICLPIALLVKDTVPMFVLKCFAFIVIYAIFLWLFGMNQFEKETLTSILLRKKANNEQ